MAQHDALRITGRSGCEEDDCECVRVYLGVEELADSGVTLKFYAEVKEDNIFAAQRQLNRDLLILFREKNIEIPFPQVDVHMKKD